ncbi:MAG TPA: hypothetical protein VIR59_07165 [Gaiellaceae bacterium]
MSCQSLTYNECAPARELAQRLSGTNEVVLLWHPKDERVELEIRDCETGVGFVVDVAPARAMDAFHHPYAYAASRAYDLGSQHSDA